VTVQDLRISARATLYRRERWETPEGERIVADLPTGIVGGFGPALRQFIAAAHFQGQVTSERLTALLNGMGLDISKRLVVRFLSQGLEDCRQNSLRVDIGQSSLVDLADSARRAGNVDDPGFTHSLAP
jgi:hypothetical protein